VSNISFRVAALSLLLLSANAQEPGAPRTAPLRDPKMFEGYERQLAQTFESLRRENNLPKLSRITRRRELDQLVCTAALTEANPNGHNLPASLMYKTSDPTSVTDELKSIARFKDLADPSMDSRYAVSVWPGTDKVTGRLVYWVGVEIYMSAFFEFIDNAFTDNRSYRNQWKELVAPSCRDIQ
jgi:hypothetical protein